MVEKARYWARTMRGLEWVACAEISSIPDVKIGRISDRSIFFSSNYADAALQLRCVDDVYRYWGQLSGLNRTREALSSMSRLMEKLPDFPLLRTRAKDKFIRVTVSFSGKRNYSRYEIEDSIGTEISKRTGLKYSKSEEKRLTDVVWCRVHLEDENCILGVRMHNNPLHRRSWRIDNQKGSLHPPLAACMTLLADLENASTVLDPFCGGGTIIVEAGLVKPQLELLGTDLSDISIKNAEANAKRAKVKATFYRKDIIAYDRFDFDRIITNPPWGNAVKMSGQMNTDIFLNKITKISEEVEKAVILVSQDKNVTHLLRRRGIQVLEQNVRVSGKLASLIVFGRKADFSETKIGCSLRYHWQSRQKFIA